MSSDVAIQQPGNHENAQRDARAMQLFETAIEKESHGLMSDAVKYYREAFKINERIDLIYRKQKVPKALEQLRGEHGKNFSRELDESVLRSINVDGLLASFADVPACAPDLSNPDHLDDGHMAIKFANMGLDGAGKNISSAPVSPLMALPQEIWISVLQLLLRQEPQAWFRFGITCKHNAYLAFHQSEIWRSMCYSVYPKQNYEENVGCLGKQQPVPSDPLEALPQYGGSWKQMMKTRPFVKFLGCYISVVNYYSEGGRTELSSSLSNPVRTVTYYRYLRFYPHGECVMALTRLEPSQVIHQLSRENPLRCLLVNYDTKDVSKINPSAEPHKIFYGRWTISTDARVHIVVDSGSVPYYFFHYHFKVKHLAGHSNHSKLSWEKFYAIWKQTPGHEDREGEVVDFSLKNEKDFKFSRVRSYEENN